MCNDVSLAQRDLEYNKSIEFASNDNSILGFFVIKTVFLYFDKKYLRVYEP